MQSTSDIYTIIFRQALRYVKSDMKKELASIIIKEFAQNHTTAEIADFSTVDNPPKHN